MIRTLRLAAILPVAFALLFVVAANAEDAKVAAVVPKQTIPLIDGSKDLSKYWYVWLEDAGNNDPRGVFTMQSDGILKISGDGFGGLITKNEYANYHLVLEYRWGVPTYRSRKDKARDSGLLLHCKGPDGNYGGKDGKPGPWMSSIEYQIIEGGVGDILVLSGKDAKGNPLNSSVTCEITEGPKNQNIWKEGGTKKTFAKGRINWSGRDPEWKDVAGFRGKNDVESPGQEWTKLEAFVSGDKLVYVVNGKVVNRATEVSPTQGKILLQTEGAELYVRKLVLEPLPSKLP